MNNTTRRALLASFGLIIEELGRLALEADEAGHADLVRESFRLAEEGRDLVALARLGLDLGAVASRLPAIVAEVECLSRALEADEKAEVPPPRRRGPARSETVSRDTVLGALREIGVSFESADAHAFRFLALTPREFEAYRLTVLMDYSQEEAARLLGVSQPTASRLLGSVNRKMSLFL